MSLNYSYSISASLTFVCSLAYYPFVMVHGSEFDETLISVL